MHKPDLSRLRQIRNIIAPVLMGPPMLAFLPALTLAMFWVGGEAALLIGALVLPILFASFGGFGQRMRFGQVPRDSVTGMLLREGFEATVSDAFDQTDNADLRSAIIVVEVDEFRELVDRHGQSAGDTIAQRCGERILATLRDKDIVARVGDSRFAICLTPVRQLDLELCVQLAGRLQATIEDPISLDGASIYVSCSIGFCLRSRAPGETATDWMDAANAALAEAEHNGPSGIRAYCADIHRRTKARSDLREEAAAALDNGQIQPWYQPQISTDTGKVTGFEALARWSHPVHGLIPPATFLPVLEDAGLMERLSQVMVYQALTALKAWDSAGVDVPRVGVNFAMDELRNPSLVDRIKWEMERFELDPDRLCVEILETVVASRPDDMITRNISGLAKLGCRIDLDDFGTGHASIASVRRFSISRIKIDRSFVMKADRDPEQQKLIGAVLTMAERLELETLAEGVETVGEHALLAQLGCDHVQGFGIGRPMPFDQTLDWITAHQAKLQDTPAIGSKTR